MADSQLYEETFNITSINAQKYDRVARLTGTSNSNDTQMTLDINTELYPIGVGENIQLVLASTLSLDGTKDERGWKDLSRSGESTLADLYDYVCRGKIYRFEEGQGENLWVSRKPTRCDFTDLESRKVFVSFGGLLLYLDGPYKKLTGLRIDYVYMLVKR